MDDLAYECSRMLSTAPDGGFEEEISRHVIEWKTRLTQASDMSPSPILKLR